MTKNKIKQINFEGQVIYVGIDVHKKDVQLSIFMNGLLIKTIRIPYNKEAIVKYLKQTYRGAIIYSAYEAGFCGYSLHYYLLANSINNIVVNAADVPMSHKEKEQKTDKRDAKQIGRCLSAGLLESIYIPSDQQLADRALTRYRDKIVTDLNRIKNRIKMSLHFWGYTIPTEFDKSYWSKNFINWLTKLDIDQSSGQIVWDFMLDQLKRYRQYLLDINKKLRNLMSQPRYITNYELLLSVGGVGSVTAWTILTEIGEITRFSSINKLCSYVGLIPNSRSSGEKQCKGRITNRANRKLRTKLIEAAWQAVRHDPDLAAKYHKMVNSKMKASRAIVSIARKLLARIRAILITGVAYNEHKIEKVLV